MILAAALAVPGEGELKAKLPEIFAKSAAHYKALDAAAATLMKNEKGEPVMKPFWEVTEEDMDAALKATTWMPADRLYFRGGGMSSHFFTQGEMPMTMCRINLIKGQGPVLQIAEGWSVNVPEDVLNTIDQRTDPTWPTTFFAPRCDGQDGPFKDAYSEMQ